jgi:hypothetical protein
MYDVEKIIYLLVGLVVFGNTFLFMGFVMTVEDRKNEKRKRKPRSKAKRKAKRKSNKKDEPINKIMDDDDIIIEEIDN